MSDENPPGEQPETGPPAEPTDPYGTTQPAAGEGAPTPPQNPYGQQPSYPQPSYGQPSYGQPAYGQPADVPAPYGQPVGQPGFPQQPFPTGGATSGPSKSMAITALILSLLICIPFIPAIVAIVLGIIVVGRSRDGVNRGKGLAVAAVIISVIAIIGWVTLVVALTKVDWDSLHPVEQLESGECITASGLSDASEEFVDNIIEVSCSDPHDAEVLVTKVLTQDEARDYAGSSDLCRELVLGNSLDEKLLDGMDVVGLTVRTAPNAGDKLACLAFMADGSQMEAPL
ncbi:DUF4190 domain-containing protein [Nocardioides sp.]|uniref:DUF4190 domain-containing protein n=1 Tax=Nocardioides sp. TaxID=35761 RepID=UPI00356A8375